MDGSEPLVIRTEPKAWSRGATIRIEVAGPPKAWKRAGKGHVSQTKDGRTFVANSYTPVETRNEQAVFRDRAETAMAGRIPLDQAIEINIAFYMPIPQSWSRKKQAAALADLVRPITKPDFDNCSKMIDALKGIVWRDDCRVTDAHIYKRYSDRPRLVIEIRGIGPP